MCYILKPSFLGSSQLAFVVHPVSINNQYWIQEQGYNQNVVILFTTFPLYSTM